MTEYLLFEYKKIFRQSRCVLFVALLAVLNLAMLMAEYKEYTEVLETSPQYYVGRQLLMERIQGEIDRDMMAFLRQEYQNTMDGTPLLIGRETYTGYVAADQMLLEQIIEQVNEYIGYEDTAKEISDKAKENIAYYKQYGNLYQQRENAQIAEAYGNRSIVLYYDLDYMTEYLNYDFSSILLLGLVLFVGVLSFQQERETGVECLQHLHCAGRSTTLSKWLAGQSILCGSAILLYGMDWLFYAFVWKLQGWQMPVYALRGYELAASSSSVLNFSLWMLLTKMVALTTLYGIVFGLSMICHSYMAAYSASFLVLAMAVYGWQEIRLINPGTLFQTRQLVQTWETVNVLGIPIQSTFFLIGYSFFVQILCLLGVWSIWWKGERGY